MASVTRWISKTRGLSRSESAPYSTQKQVGNLCTQKNAYEREKKVMSDNPKSTYLSFALPMV